MARIESTTMYTLGQLVRAVWPDGDVPPALLDLLLVQPATGLAQLIKSQAAKRVDQEQIGALMAKLPADMTDPPRGVRIEDQGPFWLGYYHYMSAIDRARNLGPDHLAKAGTLLYGERWQSDLARGLNVGDRRVREWVAGDRKIPPGIWADIAALLRQRSSEGLALLRDLDQGPAVDRE